MLSWLATSVPIILAIVAIFAPFATARLRARDARERLRADIELLGLLDPASVGHARLRDGVDRQALMLTLSLPDYLAPSRWNARRVLANFSVVYGFLVMAGLSTYVAISGSRADSAWHYILYFLGLASLILGVFTRHTAVRGLSKEIETMLKTPPAHEGAAETGAVQRH